jgi:hypothetical protein
MASRSEQIAEAVRAALSVPALATVPPSRIYRDMAGALQAERLPAIAVETGDEPEPQRPVIGFKLRTVEIRMAVFASGSNPFTAADPIVVEAHNRLAANPTLSGLAFEFDEGPTIREREDADRSIASVTKTYLYQYRTTEASLE